MHRSFVRAAVVICRCAGAGLTSATGASRDRDAACVENERGNNDSRAIPRVGQPARRGLTAAVRGCHTPDLACLIMPSEAGFRHS